MPEFFENGEIDNQITDRYSNAGFGLFRLENAEWKILNGKMRIRRNVDERTKRHDQDLTTKNTKDTKKEIDSASHLGKLGRCYFS